MPVMMIADETPAARENVASFLHRLEMGDVADEFLKPQGLSWADLENGEWTKDVATSDKVTSYFFNKSL